MDLYTAVAYEQSKHLTQRYSTSFSMSSRLFHASIRPHIYAIYGLVRIADEIVDTYQGPDAGQLLDQLELDSYAALKSGYSPNPIVHAFAQTAREFGIAKSLIKPFFASMRSDLAPPSAYTAKQYADYIYGSAEVVGLMCLRVFANGDAQLYKALKPGAQALGAAYQKVNFLRDLRADYEELGRVYFPGVAYETFSDSDKAKIIADIRRDFAAAKPAAAALPPSARKAVTLSVRYYQLLLDKLDCASAADIKTTRLRVATTQKLWLLAKVSVT